MLKKQQPTVRIQQHEAVSVENVHAKKRPHTKSSNPVPRPPRQENVRKVQQCNRCGRSPAHPKAQFQPPRGRMRRNRQHLTLLNTTGNIPSNEFRPVTHSVIPTSPEDIPHHTPCGVTVTSSGHVSKPLDRLNL